MIEKKNKGIVTKSTGSFYKVKSVENGNIIDCTIKGKFRHDGLKSTNPIAVGDIVYFEMDKDGAGNIFEIEERRNYIIRKSINLSKQIHILAANLDQAVVVVTLASPKTSTGFIDRFLITCEAYQIPAILVFNKIDLYSDDGLEYLKELKSIYEPLGYQILEVSATEKINIDKFNDLLKNKITLVSGHSGVGKSSLINAISPNFDLRVGEISEIHQKGKHTTTFAEMFDLENGGSIIDTPGIREFSVVGFEKEELSHFFPEMRDLLNECKFNSCLHINEPHCAVMKAVENGIISQSRYYNYLSLMNSEELSPKKY
jgi:ribosome biogenesis GTPase